jgi:tRNA A-37 threonylcarbamoyl transferase component Bud32
MFKTIQIPSSFSMIKKGKTLLLIKEGYKDFLIQEGIENIETFLEKYRETSHFLQGRILHPSIPLRGGERMVLRRYSHGGLLRAFFRDLYLLGSRAFREVVLTEEIRSAEIPTIQAIGAIHQRTFFLLYRAYFLSLEVPDAIDLIQYLEGIELHPSRENLSHKRKTIRSVGLLLQKFHQAGFFHGDLQLKNILLARDQPLLIDFDRSYRKDLLSIRERTRNLLRLNRSAEKRRRQGLPITRTDCCRFFQAYAGDNLEIRQAIKKALRTYSARLFFHRLGWAIAKAIGS